jgi:hypothetical protein
MFHFAKNESSFYDTKEHGHVFFSFLKYPLASLEVVIIIVGVVVIIIVEKT